MNALQLLARLPLWVWLLLLFAFVLPGLSALSTRAPSFLAGVITVVLSVLSGVAGDGLHAAVTGARFDWAQAFGAAALTWLVAAGAQARLYRGTATVARLHRRGLQMGPAEHVPEHRA